MRAIIPLLIKGLISESGSNRKISKEALPPLALSSDEGTPEGYPERTQRIGLLPAVKRRQKPFGVVL